LRLFIFSGGFALVHNQKATKDASQIYDFRESSPAIFSNESFRDEFFEGKSMYEVNSEHAIAIPGVLRGLEKLHQDYGKLVSKFMC